MLQFRPGRGGGKIKWNLSLKIKYCIIPLIVGDVLFEDGDLLVLRGGRLGTIPTQYYGHAR